MDLTRLLHPRSVAVVGATDRPGAYGAHVMANLHLAGFPGRIVAVNPTREQVLGVACIRDLAELDEPVDAVVVATPAASVPQILTTAGRLGCGGAVVFAAGFREAGDHASQEQLSTAAAEHALAVIGPNANGLVSVGARAPLWGDAVTLPEPGGSIALVTQSGNIGVIALAHRAGLGLHTVVSVGNAAVVDAAATIAHLAVAPGVRCIAAYLEDDGDGAALATALAACARADTRVVILKAGRSSAGRLAGAAHTAALAGDHAAYRALVHEAGAVLVDEPHTLLETARAMAAGRRDPRRLAVMTCSGGDAAIAADLAADLVVALAPLTAPTRATLSRLLPSTATVGNPLDHTNLVWADPVALHGICAAVSSDDEVGHVIYVQDEPPGLPAPDVAEWAATRDGVLSGARSVAVPALLVATTPGQEPVGAISGLRPALTATAALQQPAPDPARLLTIAETARAARRMRAGPQIGPDGGGGWLAEHEAKALLRNAGIRVPAGEVVLLDGAADADVIAGACAAAGRIAGPVALKISAAGLLHKTDAGAIAVNLGSASAVSAAARALVALHRREPRPGAVLLVEAMSTGTLEVFIAARRDGVVPTLTVGLGGVLAELLDDVVTLALPADPARILTALPRLRAYRALAGYAHPQNGLAHLAELAALVGALVVERPLQLVELNPVLVGEAVTAVDAVARWEPGAAAHEVTLDGLRARP